MQALQQNDDSTIAKFFSKDKFETLLMDVTTSISQNKKLVQQYQYIEETNARGIVVSRCSWKKIRTVLDINAPNPKPRLIILKTRERIITNGYRKL